MTDAKHAALTVLRAAAGDTVHWTVIWDRALRDGLINPMTDPDARNAFLRALAALAREGVITKTSTGTYTIAEPPVG